MSAKAPLWTKNFILISSLNFLLILTFYLLIIVIVGYAIHVLGASTAQAGLISGLFIIGTLVGRFLVGKVILRYGAKITLMAGLTGFLLISALYFVEWHANVLLLIRFMHGFMMGVAATVLGTVIAQIIPAQRRGEGIGYYSLSNTLGTAIGPFLAIWMMLHVGYQSIFIASSVIAALALLLATAIKMPVLQHKAPDKNSKSLGIRQYIEPKALPISMIILLCSLCYAGVLSFLNLYAKELNLVPAATLYFLTYAIAVLISRPFTGPLMDRKGENILIYPAFLCMALGLLVLSMVNSAGMLLLSAALLGFGFGNIQSISQTIAIQGLTADRMGYATSTFFICLEAGLGVGPYLLGLAIAYFSYSTIYALSAALVIFTMLLYFFVHGQKSAARRRSLNL